MPIYVSLQGRLEDIWIHVSIVLKWIIVTSVCFRIANVQNLALWLALIFAQISLKEPVEISLFVITVASR